MFIIRRCQNEPEKRKRGGGVTFLHTTSSTKPTSPQISLTLSALHSYHYGSRAIKNELAKKLSSTRENGNKWPIERERKKSSFICIVWWENFRLSTLHTRVLSGWISIERNDGRDGCIREQCVRTVSSSKIAQHHAEPAIRSFVCHRW